jgi:hypothetical protein
MYTGVRASLWLVRLPSTNAIASAKEYNGVATIKIFMVNKISL